ncbi:hypothetical protein CCP1ISM_40028 [Azospirillaceae bacterium]
MIDLDVALTEMGLDKIASVGVEQRKQYRKGDKSHAQRFVDDLTKQIAFAKADAANYPIKESRLGVSDVVLSCDYAPAKSKGRPEKWYTFSNGRLATSLYLSNQLLSDKKIYVASWDALVSVYEQFAKRATDGLMNDDLAAIVASKKKRGANKPKTQPAS